MSEIVLDLDGTLVDSHGSVLNIMQELMYEHTGEHLDMAEVARREAATFEATLGNYGIRDRRIIAPLVERWGQIALKYESEVFPGIPEMISELASEGYRLHVWTARERLSTLSILEKSGLIKFINGNIGCWNERAPKPDVRGLAEVVENANPQNVTMIGDSWSDLTGALAYGATPICALWSAQANEAKLRKLGGKFFARMPREALALIKNYSRPPLTA